jgi:predicted nucleotidyltransferase component of viral defense system
MASDDLIPVLVEVLDKVEQETGISVSGRTPLVRMRPDGRSTEGRIYYRGPRGAPEEARVKLDLTHDETVVEPTLRRKISHAYNDALPDDQLVRCYAFAEKLRALGQRTRLRDLYDVVNLHRRVELHGDRDVWLESALSCGDYQVREPSRRDSRTAAR